MLKQQARTIAALLYAADLGVTLATLPVAYLLRSEVVPHFVRSLTALYDFNMYLVLVGPIVLIWSGLLFLGGAYRSRRTERSATRSRSSRGPRSSDPCSSPSSSSAAGGTSSRGRFSRPSSP